MRKIKAYKPRKTKPKVRTIGKKVTKKREPSDIEVLFEKQIMWAQTEFPNSIPECLLEYKFHPKRKFLSDFAFPSLNLLIELEGGIWTKMGHSTGYGISKDCEKSNEAQRLGFHIFRFTSEQVKSGYAINYTINYILTYSNLYLQFMFMS